MKYHIEKNTVQETLVIPLYGRKLCTERFPDLFKDEKALELIEKIDYDFSSLESKSKSFAHRFGALEVAMRESDLMWEVGEYLQNHPKAAIVGYFLAASLTKAQPWLLAFAAGAMIFVVAEDLIPDAKMNEHQHLGTWGVMFGFAVMMALDVALG